MKTLCIYHGNCADGFGAAWAVRRSLGAENVEFLAGHYGMSTPDVTGRIVIIVDFSFPLETLQSMAQQARTVLVLDHHKTAAEALAELEPAPLHYHTWADTLPKLSAVFDMNRSGAGLTWDFFFPRNQRPALINHIEDRDLWRFKLEGTREIMADLFSYPQDFATWDLLFADDINALRLDGEAINRQHQKTVADLVRTTKRRMLIGGHDVPVANLPYMFASDAGNVMAEGELFAASYFDTPDGRNFSLRSTNAGMDVSEIAKQYGGGGHRNAAGFKVPFDHELAGGRDQHEGSCNAWLGQDGLAEVLPTVAIEGNQLVIRITTECLLHAVTCSSQWPVNEAGSPISINDGPLLIQEIIQELQREDELGTNAMHRMLDDAALAALDNGSEAVSYDEVRND